MTTFNRLTGGAGALAIAEKTLTGKPYVWGGIWPESGGTDCDGLFTWAWGEVGVVLQRPTETTVHEWPCDDRTLPNEVGDGLFMQGAPGEVNPGHVMMYARPGWVFEAEQTGTLIGLKPFDTSKWEFRTRPSLALALPLPPDSTIVARYGFTTLADPSQWELAKKNGWPVYVWDGVRFVHDFYGLTNEALRYANFHFATPRS